MANDREADLPQHREGNNGLHCSEWLLLWNHVLSLSLIDLETGKSQTQTHA